MLAVRFEDLCLNYKKTVRKIEKFLGLKSAEHVFPKMFFNPINSIPNINYWEQVDCRVDIARISLALPEYCHDFKTIGFLPYQKIRLLSHLTYGETKKQLKMLKHFYRYKKPQPLNERQVVADEEIRLIGESI